MKLNATEALDALETARIDSFQKPLRELAEYCDAASNETDAHERLFWCHLAYAANHAVMGVRLRLGAAIEDATYHENTAYEHERIARSLLVRFNGDQINRTFEHAVGAQKEKEHRCPTCGAKR